MLLWGKSYPFNWIERTREKSFIKNKREIAIFITFWTMPFLLIVIKLSYNNFNLRYLEDGTKVHNHDILDWKTLMSRYKKIHENDKNNDINAVKEVCTFPISKFHYERNKNNIYKENSSIEI